MPIYYGPQRITLSGLESVYIGQNKVYSSSPAVDYLCFTANTAGSTIALSSVSNSPDIEVSTDGENWSTWNYSAITLPSVGSYVLMRGDNPNGFNRYGSSSNFVMTGSISASGNIMTLIDGVGETTTIPCEYCFVSLFNGCSSLTTPPSLPATTLKNYCYYRLFLSCTALTSAPELPAMVMTNYCYYQMFRECTALTSAPALPATSVASYCYYHMFYRCTSLASAPALPAMAMTNYCYYQMFYQCTSLTTPPALPATTLADHCYSGMFILSSINSAPTLPATTMAPYCYSGMFSNTNISTTPALPATTLATACYQGMFNNCTSLRYIRYISATTLALWSCSEMFRYCSSLMVSAYSGSTKFFTCPSGASEYNVKSMFASTGRETDDPVSGRSYYYN